MTGKPLQFAFPHQEMPHFDMHSGLAARDYFAAHCPISMTEAYSIWADRRPSDVQNSDGFRDTIMPMGMKYETDAHEFLSFYAMLRYQYADLMVEQHDK